MGLPEDWRFQEKMINECEDIAIGTSQAEAQRIKRLKK